VIFLVARMLEVDQWNIVEADNSAVLFSEESSQLGKKALGKEEVFEKLGVWYAEVVKQVVLAGLEARHNSESQMMAADHFRLLRE
jgi:hypothetical protein